ncbi:hypothetical protein KI387_022274, partial [Taxus chinensis]
TNHEAVEEKDHGRIRQPNSKERAEQQEKRKETASVKRGHISDNSDKLDFEKKPIPDSAIDPDSMQMVVISYPGQWQEVKKKKGKKGRYANLLGYYSLSGGCHSRLQGAWAWNEANTLHNCVASASTSLTLFSVLNKDWYQAQVLLWWERYGLAMQQVA